MKCQYCNNEAELVHAKEIYGDRTSIDKMFWFCDNGHEPAYVGTYDGEKPLGTLANNHLRFLRTEAHKRFDMLWKGVKPEMTRDEAYSYLAKIMNKKPQEAHIGMFDEYQCQLLITYMLKRNAF